jgi:hypothetical protein
MKHLKFGRKRLWKRADGLIVWASGQHLGKQFSATVVSQHTDFKHGSFRNDWNKDEFELISNK